jgi:hypothetical protein
MEFTHDEAAWHAAIHLHLDTTKHEGDKALLNFPAAIEPRIALRYLQTLAVAKSSASDNDHEEC